MRRGPGRSRGARLRAGVLAAAALALLGTGACSDKITTVDATFTTPEGTASPQTGLVVWREIPNKLYIFDRGEVDPDCPVATTHVLVDSAAVATPLPGQLHGAILDSTPASAYQVFRRESNGGYRELFDFAPIAARKWIDRAWEVFHFTDPDSVVPSRTYRGRGVVGGTVTLTSPLTQEANKTVRAVEAIHYTGKTGFNACGFVDCAGLDSLFEMKWRPVTGAASYVIHVYQPSFSLTALEEQIASGMPAPLYIGKSVDILVAIMPAPNPSPPEIIFKMPTPSAHPAEARVMTVRQTRFGQEYLVRVSAVDANGQLIACTYGTFSQQLTDNLPGGVTVGSNQFAVYYLGAVRVVPTRPCPPIPNRARPGRSPAS